MVFTTRHVLPLEGLSKWKRALSLRLSAYASCVLCMMKPNYLNIIGPAIASIAVLIAQFARIFFETA